MNRIFIIAVFPLFIILFEEIYAQGPGQAFQPVIAEGAKNIYKTDQILRWKNPAGVSYNEVYISPHLPLVENLDPSTRILNGNPNVIFSSADLDPIEPLQFEVKYYWRIVEHNATDTTIGPIWYFETLPDLSLIPYFLDNFDNYIPGLQLACQNPTDWSTWNNSPCDPIEDPLISQEYFYSDSNSFHITYGNDLIKLVGPFTSGVFIISMMMYIPEGHSGYWNVLQDFNPAIWGFEVYWNSDGTGYINAGGNNSASFIFPHNTWFQTSITVDLFGDLGNFSLGNMFIYTWQWSLGANGSGGIDQLSGVDFYGFESDCDYYVDNFRIYEGYILSPTIPPRDMQAEGTNDSAPEVVIQWLPGNNWGSETGYAVFRKNGLPNAPGDYSLLTDQLSTSTLSYTDSSVTAPGVYTYKVILLPIGSPGAEVTAYVPEAVPVELISFDGHITNNGVFLKWTTATETNNKGFDVERFGESLTEKWERIGFIEGKGTTTEMNSYSFTDNNAADGCYLYRLKQIDFSGEFNYSFEIEIDLPAPAAFELRQNYPNPFNPTTQIKYSIPKDGFVSLKVYNTLGQQVASLENGFVKTGEHEITFDGSKLSSGVYYYRIESGDDILVKKMILMK